MRFGITVLGGVTWVYQTTSSVAAAAGDGGGVPGRVDTRECVLLRAGGMLFGLRRVDARLLVDPRKRDEVGYGQLGELCETRIGSGTV